MFVGKGPKINETEAGMAHLKMIVYIWGVAVSKLAERWLSKPEGPGSIPAISNFCNANLFTVYSFEDENIDKEAWNGHF